MLDPYRTPNFAFVASRLKPDQMATALATAFELGKGVALELLEDDILNGIAIDAAVTKGLNSVQSACDEEVRDLFLLGETCDGGAAIA